MSADKGVVIYGSAGVVGSTAARTFVKEGAGAILVGRTLASVDQCRKIHDGELTGPAMVASVRERFSGRSMPDLTNNSGAADHRRDRDDLLPLKVPAGMTEDDAKGDGLLRAKLIEAGVVRSARINRSFAETGVASWP